MVDWKISISLIDWLNWRMWLVGTNCDLSIVLAELVGLVIKPIGQPEAEISFDIGIGIGVSVSWLASNSRLPSKSISTSISAST